MLSPNQHRRLKGMIDDDSLGRFMDEVFPDSVCVEGERIRKRSGMKAFDSWMWERLEVALHDPEEEATQRTVAARVTAQDRPASPPPLRKSEDESPDVLLFEMTTRKIVSSKVDGVVLTYGQGLDEVQKENPELARKVLEGMNRFRENPPSPWER